MWNSKKGQKLQSFVEQSSTKLAFRPQQKNWLNRTTVLYTKYVSNTKNYFSPEPKKLTQHHNCMDSKYISSMCSQPLGQPQVDKQG